MWKKNIIYHHREKKDVLDITNEDFSKNKSLSEDGQEITPSSKLFNLHLLFFNIDFNIFRDSLR